MADAVAVLHDDINELKNHNKALVQEVIVLKRQLLFLNEKLHERERKLFSASSEKH